MLFHSGLLCTPTSHLGNVTEYIMATIMWSEHCKKHYHWNGDIHTVSDTRPASDVYLNTTVLERHHKVRSTQAAEARIGSVTVDTVLCWNNCCQNSESS